MPPPLRYPFESLLRLAELDLRASQRELREAEDAAHRLKEQAHNAACAHDAEKQRAHRELAEERARASAEPSKPSDWLQAHRYSEQFRERLVQLERQVQEGSALAAEAEQRAQQARQRFRALSVEHQAFESRKDRWLAEQKRIVEARQQEALEENWSAATHKRERC